MRVIEYKPQMKGHILETFHSMVLTQNQLCKVLFGVTYKYGVDSQVLDDNT